MEKIKFPSNLSFLHLKIDKIEFPIYTHNGKGTIIHCLNHFHLNMCKDQELSTFTVLAPNT